METQRLNSVSLAREWAKVQPSVAAYIGSLAFDFTEVDDLVQETAAQVFTNSHQYDASRPFIAWTLGVARNVVRNHQRIVAKERALFEPVVMDALAVRFERFAAHREEFLGALSACRQKLTDQQEQLCQLRYENGLSPQDISVKKNVSSGQIRMMLYRIREQLRVCVERRIGLSGGCE